MRESATETRLRLTGGAARPRQFTAENSSNPLAGKKNGRACQIRTDDPQHPMLVRYQAALMPEFLRPNPAGTEVLASVAADYIRPLRCFNAPISLMPA